VKNLKPIVQLKGLEDTGREGKIMYNEIINVEGESKRNNKSDAGKRR
jgi:hypothetical protein